MFIIGRFHLLALHLPIGIIVLAALLVMWSKWKKTTDFEPLIAFSIKIAAISAVVTAIFGWFLAQQGGYEENALWWHKWSGIAAAALCCGCWWLVGSPYFRSAVLAAAALVGTAGHFGGDLTHGTNYLFAEPKKAVALSAANPDDVAYTALVQPILDSKCVSCHNPSKAKGNLMMDSYEHLLKGGEKGLEISFGSADSSELYNRLMLPAHEEEHMPPKGRAQLSPDEISIIAKWLDAGGNLNVKVREVMPQRAAAEFAPVEVAPVDEKTLATLRTQLIPVTRLGNDLPWLSVSLKGKREIPGQVFGLLDPVALQIAHLDASHSGFNDALLSQLKSFSHLTRLNLANTSITSAALGALSGLGFLQHLNLTETNIDDGAIAILQQLPALKEIGLMGTRVSATAIQQLQNKGVRVAQAAPLDSSAQALRLNPPKMSFTKTVFDDTVQVRLDFGFKAIGLFYTLDQSSPTSQSLRYSEEPIVLSESGTVRAIAVKEGWNTSEIIEQTFAKRKYRPRNATLLKGPSPKYPGKGAASLHDNVLGNDRAENVFLGYEGEHLTATFEFEQPISLAKLTVHFLEDNNAWIFAPIGLKIWYSPDGKRWTLAKETQYASTTSLQPLRATVRAESLDQPVEAKYVKLMVQSPLKCPSWHVGTGNKCWIFVDEILFE